MTPSDTPLASPAPELGTHVADRLLDATERVGAPICVGLDPVFDRLPDAVRATHRDPVAAIEAFTVGVIDAAAEAAPCVKFQSACYERHGAPGVAALGRGMAHAAERGVIVILDAKRGDIGISAEHYAEAAFGAGSVDWVTVSPYLGDDGLAPFIRDRARGAFALVRTSNPGGDALQTLRLDDGRTLSEAVADMVDRLGRGAVGTRGYSNLGAVVGATKPQDAARLRERLPHAIFLVPGFGAQGGSADDIRGCFHDDGHGALITASRSVIYAGSDRTDWITAVRDAARRLRDEVAAVVHARAD